MKIFSTRSPIDMLDKLKLPVGVPKGRLAQLAARLEPLLHNKKTLDKVYSKGYFENHYPEADKTLKRLLHKKAMDAWAHAEDPMSQPVEQGHKGISLTINIGA